METLRIWAARLRSVFGKRQSDANVDAEISAHISDLIAENERRGMTPEEAQYAARREFGGIEQVKEAYREKRGLPLLETIAQDLRYAVRVLTKSPGFTAVTILTLALGIGANTAIFSIVNAVLLRPLPYRDASRLVVLNETTPMVGVVSVSYPNFLDWRAASHTFSQMAAVHNAGFNLAGVSQPENIGGDAVSPNFLSVLGIRPFLGRDFEASEEKAGTAPVVMLSYSLWQSHLGGDPGALGKQITLDGRGYTVIGVLPANYRAPDKTDVLVPIGVWAGTDSYATERGARGDMVALGRLAPGATFVQARAEMEGIAARLAKEYPASNDDFGVALQPIRDSFAGDVKPAILVLFGAVMFVLLIACANVANLFLARAASRTREIALRAAFGASRGRIVRQMLTESLVLAIPGGILGVALAMGGIRGIVRLIPMNMLSGTRIELDGAVLLFAASTAVLAAFLFGIVPALHSSHLDVQADLKEGARATTAGAGRNRLRGALAITEISLALILLVGAGLMVKSLYRLMSVRPGFRPERVLTMEMSLRTERYSQDSAILNFWQQVLERVRALPGVESAAVGTNLPLTGNHSRGDITVEGMAEPEPGKYPHPDIHIVSPGYVTTLGLSLLRGRDFVEADTPNTPNVALVNAMLAKRLFPNGDPVGKRFVFGHPSPNSPSQWLTIVGVVGDTKLYGLANPARLEVYTSSLQGAARNMNLLVKSANDPAGLTSAIRAAVSSVDKDQPIFAIATMNQLLSDSVATRRITLVLLGCFSGLALVLATIGIYGVISYSVSQRTHEIGIRMALGARRSEVLRLVLGQGMKLTLAGIVIGAGTALGLVRLMSSLLYGVSAADAETFVGVAVLLAIVAVLACYIPARRAMSVDPLIALRYE